MVRGLLLVWCGLRAVLGLRVLVTNDDGFETANIQVLFFALRDAGHDVVMAAPYLQQSGTSAYVQFLEPINATTQASPGGTIAAGAPGVGETGLGEGQFYVDGTPGTAVLYGLDVLANRTWGAFPDVVISGPNEGDNLGIVTPHSGTVGAAVTALNKGVRTIAVSAFDGDATKAVVVAGATLRVVDALFSDDPPPPHVGLNVNIPDTAEVTSLDELRFRITDFGTSSNVGLRFFESLHDSAEATYYGYDVPYPGVGLELAGTPGFAAAGYTEDPSPWAETTAISEGVVAVSPMQGTYGSASTRWCPSTLGSTLAPVECRAIDDAVETTTKSKKTTKDSDVGTILGVFVAGVFVGLLLAGGMCLAYRHRVGALDGSRRVSGKHGVPHRTLWLTTDDDEVVDDTVGGQMNNGGVIGDTHDGTML